MKCIKKDLIQKYIDKEATPKEVSSIEKHLEICPACAAEINYRKRLSQNIILSINQLADENTRIPEFVHYRVSPNKLYVRRKQIIYSLSAACVLLLVLLILFNTKSKDELHVIVVNNPGAEVDANRPVTKQDLVIKVIDPQGNVTELNID